MGGEEGGRGSEEEEVVCFFVRSSVCSSGRLLVCWLARFVLWCVVLFLSLSLSPSFLLGMVEGRFFINRFQNPTAIACIHTFIPL